MSDGSSSKSISTGLESLSQTEESFLRLQVVTVQMHTKCYAGQALHLSTDLNVEPRHLSWICFSRSFLNYPNIRVCIF